MSEPTLEQITMAAIAFVGNDMWDSLDKFGKAKARTRARKALIVAAPSPSPAPGVVEAAYLLLSEIDAGNDAEHINGATGPLRTALASLSQSAKGAEGGE